MEMVMVIPYILTIFLPYIIYSTFYWLFVHNVGY
jgi:hypothetical protein